MRTLVHSTLVLLATTGPAAADQPDASIYGACFETFVNYVNPPIDCPLYYYAMPDSVAPRAYVLRASVRTDVTGSVTKVGPTPVDLGVTTVCHEDGRELGTHREIAQYDEYEITLAGANVGEQVYIEWFGVGVAQAAGGTCAGRTAPNTQRPCTLSDNGPCGLPIDEEPGQASGCTTGGGTLGVGLALAALVLVRRRSTAVRARARP